MLQSVYRFVQAKIADDGFSFRLESIFATAPAASKNDAGFKSGHKWLNKNLALLCESKTVTHSVSVF